MNNLEIVKRVNNRSENVVANFDRLLSIYPEIVCDSEAVDMINSFLLPMGHRINDEFKQGSIKYFACGSSSDRNQGGGHPCGQGGGNRGHSACGSSNDHNQGGGHPCGQGGGYTGHSVCGQNCKSESEMVKRLIPIRTTHNSGGDNNAIVH